MIGPERRVLYEQRATQRLERSIAIVATRTPSSEQIRYALFERQEQFGGQRSILLKT
jgi:hypothetical protein